MLRVVATEHGPEVMRETDQYEKAVTLLGFAEALLGVIGAAPTLEERRVYERGIATAREILDNSTFERAWAQGRAMSMEQAVELAQRPF
jgi:hypothetical protein